VQSSMMIIKKDYNPPHIISLFFDDDSKKDRSFVGPVARITFGKEQYTWHSAMRDGYADPDGPALHSVLPGGQDQFTLPAASMTVLRGRVE